MVQADVFDLINHAHAATAHFFEHAVVRDGLANHERERTLGMLCPLCWEVKIEAFCGRERRGSPQPKS